MRMTHLEYRDAIATLGLTQVSAAHLLGVASRTSRHWAKGDRNIPPPVARFLRFLIADEIHPAYVLKALSNE